MTVEDDNADGEDVGGVDGDEEHLCLGGQSYERVVQERGVGKVGFLTAPETSSSLSSPLSSSSPSSPHHLHQLHHCQQHHQ